MIQKKVSVVFIIFLFCNIWSIPVNACSYTIFPESKNFTSTGGDQVVTIHASSKNCSWSSYEDLTWVSVSPANGTGKGVVKIHVDSNPDSSIRHGTVNIDRQEFTIIQLGHGRSLIDQTDSYAKKRALVSNSVEDSEGNIYKVIGAAQSVESFDVYADTGIETEKIIGGFDEKLTRYWQAQIEIEFN